MDYTQEQLEQAGVDVPAAAPDAWRVYDERDPVPGYFQFDWLSSRHPDLYHRFALSSTGLVERLAALVDLTGLHVLDAGAGTGRITSGVARTAARVTAVDIFQPVLVYGRPLVRQAGLENVGYVRGDNARLPLPDSSVDAVVCAWAIFSYPEAHRVLKPGGYLIDLMPAPGTLCGELTATLAEVYPDIVTEIAPDDLYDPSCPDCDSVVQSDTWAGVAVTPPIRIHEFTYVGDYGDVAEAAAIIGRLYGPQARQYLLGRNRSSLSWRLRVIVNRVRK